MYIRQHITFFEGCFISRTFLPAGGAGAMLAHCSPAYMLSPDHCGLSCGWLQPWVTSLGLITAYCVRYSFIMFSIIHTIQYQAVYGVVVPVTLYCHLSSALTAPLKCPQTPLRTGWLVFVEGRTIISNCELRLARSSATHGTLLQPVL